MMFTITKEFHFSAGHHLTGLPAGHKCARPHGHNYIVVVELQAAQLNDKGFVVDYGDLTPLKHYIDQIADHYYLNDVFQFQTSAESLARHFYEWCKGQWPQTAAVRVSETPKTWAEYRGAA
jgi:6-pyruvoyltetrahydropterin/6-carboxytetrahydropterin synthase